MLRKRLDDLLEFIKDTDLQEVVWEKKGAVVSVRRTVLPEKPNASSAAGVGVLTAEKPAGPILLRSTMVGTFYRSDSPDRPPFVVEGTIVNAGQPVAAIEAMKIMKDVLASNPCKIVKALVANGHPVEYGQPLFEIEPQANNV